MLTSNLPAVVILWIAHQLVTIAEQVLAFVRWIRRNARSWSNHRVQTRLSGRKQSHLENDMIELAVRKLDKIPSHIAIMLGPEVPNYHQLAQFIFWSLAAGVGYVSFYDHRGTLKTNYHRMLDYVRRQSRDDGDQILWTPELKPTDRLLPARNGFRRRAVISFFGPEDGKRQLLAATRTITSGLRDGSITAASDVTVELVDRTLQDSTFHIPDPELAVYFGSICCTYGMLPWQIRLTEFVPLEAPSLAEVGPAHFLNCLFQYAKCEQRFGK
ncbi:dehydrodolichyl diphosphate synthase complex subunit Nus1 [Topomyia yanbarensis]|uniref:dehydrodolichyl diphosphate synthase complex subunit Nus1 n=1 Tax=Topomyia yanbarensis TaxID=2498891 RepID=UPI00273B0AD0|nr:dehydrodolichyl diphosphate synthase complex subunit Nus1 [Topomyia yanbarensis]